MWCRLTWHGTGNITMPFPKPRGTCTRGLLRTNQRVAHTRGWPWHPRNKHDWHPPMCPPQSPPRPLHCMGFIIWGLLGAIPHPNHDPLHTPQSEPHPKSNANPTRDPHPCMNPHSALHVGKGIVVPSALLTSHPWIKPVP